MTDYTPDADSIASFNHCINSLRERLEKSKVVIGDATLYNEDAGFVLPTLIGVGLIVTDPPYGINYRSNHNSSRRGQWARWSRTENLPGIVGDDKPLDPEPLLKFGVPTIIFGGNYCSDRLPASRCWIIWDKRDGISPNNQADCELAWTNLDKPSRIHRQMWSGLLRAGEENIARSEKQHPHQKPVALMRSCIEYAGGGTVLDPYMGSASTGVAAVRLGLPFIGIEIDKKYFDIACRRIEEAYRQPDMFVAPPSPKPEQMSLLTASSDASLKSATK
jgi:site-specific DNA-methyltransferase (adenine-specific)/modification methylase